MSFLTVNFLLALDDRFDRHPPVALKLLIETALASRVTGDPALLFHHQQHGVVVAVETDVLDRLHMPRLLALAPEFPARARPVDRPAFLRRRRQRLAVHPRERQHLAAPGLLRDRRHEPVGAPLYRIKPGFVHGKMISGMDAPIPVPAKADLQPDFEASRGHTLLGLTDGVFAEVKDAGREHGVGVAQADTVPEMIEIADAAGGDHRNADGIA